MLKEQFERVSSILDNINSSWNEFLFGGGPKGPLFHSVPSNLQEYSDQELLNIFADALIERNPSISKEWILTGQGGMWTYSVKTFPLKTDRQVDDQDIPLYDLAATAGLVAIYNDLRPDPVDHLRIPNLPPVDGAVYVRGDSMSPLLKSGDIIIFKKVELSAGLILWGQIYLLSYTAGGDTYTVVKYVKRSSREGCIQLVSENAFYDPMDIPASSITALALVKASITFYTME